MIAVSATNRVLVTGSTGFVGRQLCATLAARGTPTRVALRAAGVAVAPGAQAALVGEISERTDWSEALRDVDAVIHLAARVHVMHDAPGSEQLFMQSNAEATRNLAAAAALAGVRRFVFVSSIKVNGEATTTTPFTPSLAPAPVDAYGRSKLRAEQYLGEIAGRSAMQAVIVRPPLVYGPDVRANFLRLLRWVERGVPLPFDAVRNRRSMVNLWNLCDLIVNLLDNPGATRNPWLVSDGEDLATPELIRHLADAMQRRARLVAVPLALLRVAGALTGKSAEVARLCGSLQVDCRAEFAALGWRRPVSAHEGLARTAAWYLRTNAAA